jgi:hypothetical protein
MDYIKSICERWRSVIAVYYDHTGTKGMDEQISCQGFPGLFGVDWSHPLKHSVANMLKQLMMTTRNADKERLPADARRRFEMPLDQDVYAEFNFIQWEQTEGSEIYTFSCPSSSHDDRFWATCLAVYATRFGAQNPIHPKGGLVKHAKN